MTLLVLAGVLPWSGPAAAEGGGAPSLPLPVAGWLGDGSNRYPDAAPTTTWGPAANLAWSTPVGTGYASATVVAGRLFVTAEPSTLLCLDAVNGKALWKQEVSFADLPEKTAAVPAPGDADGAGAATPTPVSDGRFVYASFGSGLVACCDVQGKRQWTAFLTGTAPGYGRCASPLLVGDRLLLSIGCLLALDARTGKEVWRAEAVKESYGTPARAQIGGVEVVIAPTGEIVRVADGVVLAATDGMAKFSSPIVHDGVAYFMDVSALALQLPAGPDQRPQKKWEASLEGDFYASPVFSEGLLFSVNDQGTLSIVDAKDGAVLVTQALPFQTTDAHVYGSPAAVGKHIFISNTAGETVIIEAARTYKEVRTNRLPEGSGGTATFQGARMFCRGGDKLFGIGPQ